MNYLLEAVAQVRKNQPVKLIVIGEPKGNGIIVKLVRKLGIGDIVHFTGRIQNEEFADYYSRATVAVVPSVYEGFGIPAAEAMACGVPLITTSGGALPEVVGNAAMIVPPADTSALTKAITHLLNNPEERVKYAQAGLERVNSVFSWPKAAKKWSRFTGRQLMVTVDFHELKLKPRALLVAEVPGCLNRYEVFIYLRIVFYLKKG